MKLSIYKQVKDVESTEIIDLDIYLDNIKTGTYWEHVAKVREAKTELDKTNAKKSIPLTTISGTFAKRKDDALIDHSGFICIDIDKIEDTDETKSLVCADDYVYSCFTSCSGKGLAIIIKIDGNRHRDAFNAISEYLFTKYSLVVDPTCINVSRGRFVSHDPSIYINTKSLKWKDYIPKKDISKVFEKKIIFVKSDFDSIVSQIQKRSLDISGSYLNWLRIGFAIADKFGEDGRDYWQIISQFRNGDQAKNSNLINRQYDACLKAKGGSDKGRITIASFYWFAKQANIETYSIQTKEIIKISSAQKRSAGMNDAEIISNLKEHSELDHNLIDEVVPQVDANTFQEDLSLIELAENEIKTVWNIRRNVISRALELEDTQKDWIRLETIDLNTIFLKIKKSMDKLNYDLFERILMSRSTIDYNPFHDFVKSNIEINQKGHIEALANTITSDFGFSPTERIYFMKKWLVGMISSIHGIHSPLMLVLTGENQNTGKTQFFRRLLPNALKPYYAESKMDAGKDDEILMSQKLLLMDDEMGGKSKKEIARIKELTSKQIITVREPYGRNNVDLQRLAVFGGTSNENGVLSDPTGNRRVIPIHVKSIDHATYNAIDKTFLFMEAYWLWRDGFTHDLTKEDIDKLNRATAGNFDEVSPEEELVFKFFKLPIANEGQYYTTMEIITTIDLLTKQKLYHKKVGAVLQKNKVIRSFFKRNGLSGMGYKLVKIDNPDNQNEEVLSQNDPFASSENITVDFIFSEETPF
jgi:predicted P-loop ATPase